MTLVSLVAGGSTGSLYPSPGGEDLVLAIRSLSARVLNLPARFSAEVSGWYDGASYNALTRNKGFGD